MALKKLTIKQQQNKFVCALFSELRSQGTTDSFYFNTVKKSLLKSSYPKKFLPNPSIIPITWNPEYPLPPPWGSWLLVPYLEVLALLSPQANLSLERLYRSVNKSLIVSTDIKYARWPHG